jgi:choline monooxygenase
VINILNNKAMYHISPQIESATTLPGTFYHTPEVFETVREQVFARSWQLVTEAGEMVKLPGDALPFRYMDGFLDEPLLLLRNQQQTLKCYSNVCTHRGKILVEHPTRLDRGSIICGYHGRRFDLDGQFVAMPETQGMLNFPCADDHLIELPVKTWRQFIFTSLDPAIPFDAWVGDMERKVGFLPIEHFKFSATRSRDYLVHANWALYCDNYLEGFHIPFIHKGLAKSLDWGQYRTELGIWSNCQIGIGQGGEEVFQLPDAHEDAGKRIVAYYFWLFPNIMFNFYPWGLSVNIVRPLGVNLTKVSFRAYIWDPSKMLAGAGADVDLVEREDEAVVEQVQIGTQSRFYKHGRFAPRMEQGVHQFHQLLATMLSK